jgi:hypothetical protein
MSGVLCRNEMIGTNRLVIFNLFHTYQWLDAER